MVGPGDPEDPSICKSITLIKTKFVSNLSSSLCLSQLLFHAYPIIDTAIINVVQIERVDLQIQRLSHETLPILRRNKRAIHIEFDGDVMTILITYLSFDSMKGSWV